MPSQEFAEKLFRATVNAQIVLAQTASVGIAIVVDLLELFGLLKEKTS